MPEEDIALMDPMLPSPITGEVQDMALDLSEKAARLAATLHPQVQVSIGALVRSMNCYYSNLIEGHDTHPRDIDRALRDDFSTEPQKRNLQLEAKAHIRLQQRIDEGAPACSLVSADYICWLHREFCEHLPDDLLWVENPDSGEKLRVVPGKLRDGDVAVGRHIPPHAENLPRFLGRFSEAYDPERLGKMERIVAAAASHHRLLWIHPFFDGNGRVARLLSHAYLKYIGIGSSLWSVARGLARNSGAYKVALSDADAPRQGALDGRGSLTQKGLEHFCAFFLTMCVDQVTFMGRLLKPDELLRRIEIYIAEETSAKRLPSGAYPLLREALLAGGFERGQASSLTGYKDRQARSVLKALLDAELLVSDTPKGSVRLGFPISVVERWFPSLYPTL